MTTDGHPIPAASGCELLKAAYDGDLDRCFNKQTRTIALEGPRGVLLAYLGNRVPPNPENERYLTYYPERYTIFDGTEVPATVRADVGAFSMAVPHVSDTRGGVTSGAPAGMGAADTTPGPEDWDLPVGGSGAIDAAGISVRRHGTEITAGQGGLAVTGDGVAMTGDIQTRGMTSRGSTTESFLAGIPAMKTIVTFPAGDYLPDLQKIARIGRFMLHLRALIDTITGLIDVLPNENPPPRRP